MHKNGYPFSEDECSTAAKNRDLNTLKRLRDNNCPWNSWVTIYAV